MPIDEQMGYDERLRLLYVACTRAMDHLVVSLHRAERKNPPDAKRKPHQRRGASSTAWATLVDGLPDLCGDPEPLAGRPGDRADPAARLRRVGSRADARPRRRRPPGHGRRHRPHRRGRARPGSRPRTPRWRPPSRCLPPMRRRRANRPSSTSRRRPRRRSPGDSRGATGGRGRRPGPDRSRRRRPRAAEAAARPRPAAVAEGPLRHRGRPGRPRRAPDHRPRHRATGSTTPSPPSARPRRCPTAPTTSAGLVAGRPRLAVGAERPPLRRTGERSTPARPIGDRLLEGYVDLLYRADDGLVVVDYKTSATADPAELDRRVEGYRLQGAAYARRRRPRHRRAGHPRGVPVPHAAGRRRARAHRPRRRHGRRRAPGERRRGAASLRADHGSPIAPAHVSPGAGRFEQWLR